MSPEAQRIAIAELCGWTMFPSGKDSFGTHCEAHAGRGNEAVLQTKLPDYLNDLNAMRDAVMTLKDTKRGFYNAQLSLVAVDRNLCSTVKEPEWIFALINASAAHRAEAFLKTCGKWDDSK